MGSISQRCIENADICVRPSLDGTHLRYHSFSNLAESKQDIKAVPLLSWAWIFQERHLARRTVHFDPGELVMECKTNLFCECTALNGVLSITLGNTANLQKTSDDQLYKYWLDLVAEYSKLQLTQKSDRLLALLGIATMFKSRLNVPYCVGIWETDIVRGLLWQLTRRANMEARRRTFRPNPPIAPSWSWASMVLYPEGTGVLFQAANDGFFEADTQFNYNITGAWSNGMPTSLGSGTTSLSLRGKAISALHTYNPDCRRLSSSALYDFIIEEEYVLVVAINMDLDESFEDSTKSGILDGTAISCVLLGYSREKVDDSEEVNDEPSLYTLVLRQLEVSGKYQRMGLAHIYEDVGLFPDNSLGQFDLV